MSGIEYGRLRSLTAREITGALRRDGFALTRQRGSHQQYHHSDGRFVTVAFSKPGETFVLRTLKSMIEVQARWTKEDLIRLGLLK